VHFLGFRRDIYSVMRIADVVCVPSVWHEAFGLVAAEAMALGKPVIVSNRGALPHVVHHGEAGIVFDPDRPQDLTAALRKLIAEPEYAKRLGAYGPSDVRRRFSYERWAREVAAVLQDVVTG
jgi:glycosyltransferase involved in cell wall biosynthesis